MLTKIREQLRAWLSGRDRAADRLAAATVVFVCVALSIVYLFGYRGMGGFGTGGMPENYSVAISLAHGQGFRFPIPSPEVEAFLAQERDHLAREDMPEPAPEYFIGRWDKSHRYLLHYIAGVWTLFGVSWHTFKLALIPPFVAAGLLAYALLRLAAGPRWSALGAIVLMSSPVMSESHFCARDFIKAPFAYAVVLAAGYLLRFPVTPRRLLAVSAAGGVALGLGYGFRQDLLMFLPVLMAGILLGAHGPQLHVSNRVVSAGLALLCAMGAAFPIVRQVVEEEGAAGYHDLLMGWTRLGFEQLQLERGSYEIFYEHHDDFPYALRQYQMKYQNHTIFPQPLESWRDSQEARELLLETAWWFPADWATRGLGALRAGLTSTKLRTGFASTEPRPPYLEHATRAHEALGSVLSWLAPLLALGGLLWVGARDLPRAWLLLFLLLYITGYTSLQFALRHAFHLSIIPIWLVVAGVAFAIQRLRDLRSGVSDPQPRLGWPRLLLVGLHAAAAVLMILLPYSLLSRVQDTNMRSMMAAYRDAPLEPVEVVTEEQDGWRMYRLPQWDAFMAETDHLDEPGMFAGVRPETTGLARFIAEVVHPTTSRVVEVALSFEAGATQPFPIFLDYHPDPDQSQFERQVTIHPPRGGGRFVYYFPAWDTKLSFEPRRAQFAGFGLRPEDAARLVSVHRVKQAWRLPLPLNFMVPEKPEDFRPRNTLGKWLAD